MWFQIGSKNSIAKPLKIQSQIFQNSITKPLKSVPKFQSHPCSWNQSFLLNFSLKIKFQSQIEIAKFSIVRLKFFNLGAFGSCSNQAKTTDNHPQFNLQPNTANNDMSNWQTRKTSTEQQLTYNNRQTGHQNLSARALACQSRP